MGVSGYRWARFLPMLALAAACGSQPPASPTPVPPQSALRITGLPDVLSPGATAQLKAEVAFATGTTKDCAAAWSADDPRVVAISASGLATAGITGYAKVTAVCDGMTAQAETKVEARSPYKLVIIAYDSEVRTEFGVAATMEFLDGPRAGERIPTGSIFQNGVPDVTLPAKVRFTAEGYEPKDFVLAESTGTRRNPSSPLFDFWVPMIFASDPSTDTYVRTMSQTVNEIAHAFTMRAPGSVRVRTWWSVDYNDQLTIELWCAGQMLRTSFQRAGSAGSGFTQDVQTAGACEVRLRQSKFDASTHYRVAITYPH